MTWSTETGLYTLYPRYVILLYCFDCFSTPILPLAKTHAFRPAAQYEWIVHLKEIYIRNCCASVLDPQYTVRACACDNEPELLQVCFWVKWHLRVRSKSLWATELEWCNPCAPSYMRRSALAAGWPKKSIIAHGTHRRWSGAWGRPARGTSFFFWGPIGSLEKHIRSYKWVWQCTAVHQVHRLANGVCLKFHDYHKFIS